MVTAGAVQKQDSTGTTNHVWDAKSILLETGSSEAIEVVYTVEPAGYGQVLSQSRSGTDSSYIYDALGSVRQLANSSGAITDTYLFDSFGNALQSVGLTVNPFRFNGRTQYYVHTDLAQLYVRARYYDVATGRWLSVDPIRGDACQYAYVRNGPPNAIDPSGEDVMKLPPPPTLPPVGLRPLFPDARFCTMTWCQFCQGAASASNYFSLVRAILSDIHLSSTRNTCTCDYAAKECQERLRKWLAGDQQVEPCTLEDYLKIYGECFKRLTGHYPTVSGWAQGGQAGLSRPGKTFAELVEGCATGAHERAHNTYEAAHKACGDPNQPAYWDCYCQSEVYANAVGDAYSLFLLGVATMCFKSSVWILP